MPQPSRPTESHTPISPHLAKALVISHLQRPSQLQARPSTTLETSRRNLTEKLPRSPRSLFRQSPNPFVTSNKLPSTCYWVEISSTWIA